VSGSGIILIAKINVALQLTKLWLKKVTTTTTTTTTGHMQVCISLQTDNHASTPPRKVFTGRMPFLPPNQQRQSTEGSATKLLARIS